MFNFIYEDVDFSHKIDKNGKSTEDYNKHLHCFNEILYVVSGKVDYTVENETHTLSSGDLVFIKPGQYHFADPDLSLPYERYVFKFPEKYIPEYLKNAINKKEPFFAHSQQHSWLFRQFDVYYGNYTNEETKTLFLCDTLKIIVFLAKQPNLAGAKSNNLISSIISYIDKNIKNPISLDTLNKEFNFSKSYISNEFRKYMKIPVMQYVRAKKIIAAHQMILSGEKKTTVAEYFGFENYSTFYRSYLNVIGVSPSEITPKTTINKTL